MVRGGYVNRVMVGKTLETGRLHQLWEGIYGVRIESIYEI